MSTKILNQFGQEMKNTYRLGHDHSDATDLMSTQDTTGYCFRADGRATYDEYYVTPLSTGFAYISPDNENDWKLKSVDERELAHQQVTEIIEILLNSSPDLDRALHDMHQFCNTGWSIECDDPTGLRVLENAQQQMADLGQDFDAKIDELISSGFLWGALYSESIFDLNGSDFVDLAIISPAQARFQRRDGEVRGQYWQLGQEEKGRFVELTDPTIMYKNLNPIPDKPFGRPMVSSAIFGLVFQLGLLKSLRQVIDTQAWPRQFWKIDRELLSKLEINPKGQQAIIDDNRKKIEQYMTNSNLQKAKQPIVGSEVNVDTVGGVNRANFGAVETIQRMLDTWITRGLKQYPILFGINSGSGLSDNSGTQLEAHTIFIESFQSSIEKMINRQLQLILNAAGYPNAVPRFQLDRVNSLVRKSRSETLKLEVDAVSEMIKNRIINRQEGRQLLKSFSTQLDIIDEQVPVMHDVTELIDLLNTGVLSVDEVKQLLNLSDDDTQRIEVTT